jgi:cytidine deaminase
MQPDLNHVTITATRGVKEIPLNLAPLLGLFYTNLAELPTVPLCSQFRTYALIESESGNIYTGTNVEGWNFLNCWCAERDAISELARHEQGTIRHIIIGSHHPHLVLTPGGPCREMIHDFSTDHTLIIMPSEKEILISTAKEMYPCPSPYRVKAMPFQGATENDALKAAAVRAQQHSGLTVEKIIQTCPRYSELILLAQRYAEDAIAPYYGLKTATVIQCEKGRACGVSIESVEYCSSSPSCKTAVAQALACRAQLGNMLQMVTVDRYGTILPPSGETRQLLADYNDAILSRVKELKILAVDYFGSAQPAEMTVVDLSPYPATIK